MEKLSLKELQSKYAELLKVKGSLICTTDGQAFHNNENGKQFALNHIQGKQGVEIIEVEAAKESKPAPKKKASTKTTKKTK